MDLKNKTVNGYFFTKRIGSGSFGTIYKALDTEHNTVVAVKAMDIQKMRMMGMTQKVHFEVKLMESLSHPNLLSSKKSFCDKNNYYVIMDFFREGSLDLCLKQVGKFPEPDAVFIVTQLLNGLLELHARKILHRDIKPDNILKDGNRFVICDFGLSKQVESTTMTPLGTPLFEAPEILTSQPYDSKVDLWAIGVTFYSLLMGHPPFNVKTRPELLPAIKQFCGKNLPFEASISEPCKDVIRRLLEYDPRTRITWDELLNHLIFAPSQNAISPDQSILQITQDDLNEQKTLLRASGKRNCVHTFDDNSGPQVSETLLSESPPPEDDFTHFEDWVFHESKLLKSTLKCIDLMRGLPIANQADVKAYLALYLLRVYTNRTEEVLEGLEKNEAPLKIKAEKIGKILENPEIKKLVAEFRKNFKDFCKNCREKILELDLQDVKNEELLAKIETLKNYKIVDKRKFLGIGIKKFLTIFDQIGVLPLNREQTALFHQAFAMYYYHINFDNFAFIGNDDVCFDWDNLKNWVKKGNHQAYLGVVTEDLRKRLEGKSPRT